MEKIFIILNDIPQCKTKAGDTGTFLQIAYQGAKPIMWLYNNRTGEVFGCSPNEAKHTYEERM